MVRQHEHESKRSTKFISTSQQSARVGAHLTFVQMLNTFDVIQIVKPPYANLRVDFWVDPRKLGFSQPSICLFHDSIRAGSPILDALNELKSETCT